MKAPKNVYEEWTADAQRLAPVASSTPFRFSKSCPSCNILMTQYIDTEYREFFIHSGDNKHEELLNTTKRYLNEHKDDSILDPFVSMWRDKTIVFEVVTNYHMCIISTCDQNRIKHLIQVVINPVSGNCFTYDKGSYE